MTAGGLMIVLIAGGGLGLAVVILAAFYLLSSRTRLNAAARDLNGSNPELARAFTQFQADVEKGQRGL
ncbi:hypothetical protein E3O44_16845 [Cryobacterium algoricola]|uniref:Uncharacterized protein n=2 Tax=Cryobacterium TaxID=69578 RepID=A0AA41QXY2_9MICO|nr:MULTISPECIES: hypothetical protein [Cryobacterium]MCI4659505.1 hypothetical protein [Cryobacterium zhongshanensis]TFB84143.1 hypothetical protein E3O44_16845 [Cryobacterium algoricola]